MTEKVQIDGQKSNICQLLTFSGNVLPQNLLKYLIVVFNYKD